MIFELYRDERMLDGGLNDRRFASPLNTVPRHIQRTVERLGVGLEAGSRLYAEKR